MSHHYNSLFETYIDVYKRYVDSLLDGTMNDLSRSFYKEDVDYYWAKLTSVEQDRAVKIIQEWNAHRGMNTLKAVG